MKDGILLVDDSKDDALLIEQAFKKAGWEADLNVVTDGKEAIHYLRGDGCYSDRTQFKFPDLMLLDLHMPGVNGVEVLGWVRSKRDLKNLPVVVLSDSHFVEDINRVYRLGAYSFFMKTPNFEDAVKFCLSICDYRLAIKAHAKAQMPPPVWPARETVTTCHPSMVEEVCFPCSTCSCTPEFDLLG